MALLVPLGDKRPRVAPDAFVAPNATLIGDVTIEAGASVWFGAVLRGDTEPIRIGPRSNVQDNVVIHADPGYPATIGAGVTVGHGAIVHGATIGDDSLVGMGATLLNGARVGPETLIGAKALIGEGKEFPPRTLLLGIPAQVKRELDDAAVVTIRQSADSYVERAQRYRGEGLDR
jgi:carbonic anhydrase/acetyltransferase-like protein (isoleucine patch superfamily)